ncbi:Crp/Fnr family transcriptional regulator [Ramlibacter rhizophilus]|uniref:Crp/Fnr family transcriptional regulator n=1 Tax=Ramlibacter rhizophilus TaxID=1781167 RepID=A0A4Z0BSX7_9BURK|nr:Crp/Fnr family transcriptional regulator [Ramlibacter rhizophilus]TFZ01358.1 Crp/Fnr family transcriptional regulator [Ramlibacter rhizophilus]
MPALTPAQADRVHRDVLVREFASGATVCARGTPSVHWIGVVEGMLKVETVTPAGKCASFAGVPAGAWVGEGAVLKGEPRPYDVVAIRDSVVALMPRATFQWLMEQSNPFNGWLINQLNARLGHFIALVQSLRLNDTKAQVAYCLASLFNRDLYPGTTPQLAISQEEIGRLSGVSRQIANRALHEMQDKGVIRIGYGMIEVLDLPALQAMAHGEEG